MSRTIVFDINKIVNDEIDELLIKEVDEKAAAHYTEVILEDVFHIPVGRTINKLKEHLTGIYRAFIREGLLELRFCGEILTYTEPAILKAPYFKNKDGLTHEWKKSIEFDFGNGLSVDGFAAILEVGTTARAGFSLFRRGRVIQGSGDEGYRPASIFGSSNSFRYQRLFGELHLKGFEVSHTKDGFRWDDNEQPFLELLREHLNSGELPLLRQAEGYRVNLPRPRLVSIARKAVTNTTKTMETRLPGILEGVVESEPVETPSEETPMESVLVSRCFNIRFRDKDWSINIELTDDPAESQWLAVTDISETSSDPRKLNIRVSMIHPFMVRFAQNNSDDLEALLRVAVAIAVSEVLARDTGVRQAGTVRRNINSILKDALSCP